jgi:hypothetical protein
LHEAKGVSDDLVLGAVMTVLDLPTNESFEALGDCDFHGLSYDRVQRFGSASYTIASLVKVPASCLRAPLLWSSRYDEG